MDNNSFSWERMSLLARYYMPSIKKQLLIYVMLIGVFCLASVLKEMTFWWSFMFVMLWGIMQMGFSYLFYLAPVVFSRYDDPVLSTLIPAKGSEKAIFIIGYSLVFIPLFIHAMVGFYSLIVSFIPGDYSFSVIDYKIFGSEDIWEELSTFMPPWIIYVSYFVGYLWMTAMTLYVVTASRTNKIIKAILTTIIVPIALTILGVILGVIYTFNHKANLKSAFDMIEDVSVEDTAEATGFVTTFMEQLFTFLISYQGLMTVVGIIFVYLTWRKIVHNQV